MTKYPKFQFGDRLTDEQINFFRENGFIHFEKYLQEHEVSEVLDSLENVQQKWIEEDRKKINGVPIFWGQDHTGRRVVHRFPFTSRFSDPLHALVNRTQIRDELPRLMDREDGRLGENEKDGVVVNQYYHSEGSKYKQLGWHVDGLRDIFYFQPVLPMLNVGIYFTDSRSTHGGLRVLPGTHNDGVFKMLFKKAHFVSNKPDKKEVAVDARAGDLTVHHGNAWHRVALSPYTGEVSRRVVMYVPIICGKENIKHEKSPTPLYQRLRALAKK